jgi:hypothetical protein
LITHLHVAHVCGDPYYQWRKTFLGPLFLITLNSVYCDFISPTGDTIVDEFSLLIICAFAGTISWMHMCVSVIRGMCKALDIPFWTVPKRCYHQQQPPPPQVAVAKLNSREPSARRRIKAPAAVDGENQPIRRQTPNRSSRVVKK